MTKKELKRFKTSNSEEIFFCKSPDSLEHAFLECFAGLNVFQEILAWFNNAHRVNFTPSKIQQLFKDYDLSPNTSPNLIRRFGILVVTKLKNIIILPKCWKRLSIVLNWNPRYLYNGKLKNAKVNQSQQVAKSVICHSCSVPDVGDLGGKGNSRT